MTGVRVLKGFRFCAALALALLSQLALAADGALTNEDVVRLSKGGIGDAVILAKIETSATAFDTSVDALLALSEAGLGDEVIAAMVKAGHAAPGSGAAATRRGGGAAGRPVAGSTFRDSLGLGGEGPEMVVVPAGRFRMGCLSNDEECSDDERPVRDVVIAQPFALSVYEVTFADWDACVSGAGCPHRPDDQGWGRGRRPVIDVSWDDAREYVAWLSSETGAEYRLPSESEWEYAARAGTTTKYHGGDEVGVNRANCRGCGSQWDGDKTAPVGSFAPNAFGLYDMHGNVFEWLQDCWNDGYAGAPSDGSAWLRGRCDERVLRGGSWSLSPRYLRAAVRVSYSTGNRDRSLGFRVARTLTP